MLYPDTTRHDDKPKADRETDRLEGYFSLLLSAPHRKVGDRMIAEEGLFLCCVKWKRSVIHDHQPRTPRLHRQTRSRYARVEGLLSKKERIGDMRCTHTLSHAHNCPAFDHPCAPHQNLSRRERAEPVSDSRWRGAYARVLRWPREPGREAHCRIRLRYVSMCL